MRPPRPLAITAILLIATLAWGLLGSTLLARTGVFDDRLSQEVALLWGGPQAQRAPTVFWERARTVTETVPTPTPSGPATPQQVQKTILEEVPLPIASSRINVRLFLEPRQRGLLWYDTYRVEFRATYRARNTTGQAREIATHLAFPSDQIQFDNFVFRINGQDAPRSDDVSKGATARVAVAAGSEAVIEVAYDSRGLDTWSYHFVPQGVAQVQDFGLTLATDFGAVDFVPGSMSPTVMRATDTGRELEWQFGNLLTGRTIGVDLPNRQNPGPLAARITYFAPVSLLFFVTVMVILGVLRSDNLHPMHYAFLSAAFFAFHLLLAYLVDHLSIHVSFAIAAATSLFLVTSYLRVVAGPRFAFARAGLAQLVFLVLFSYAFFFEGYAGLTVTIGSVVTLFVLMQATARVDWTRVFDKPRPEEARLS